MADCGLAGRLAACTGGREDGGAGVVCEKEAEERAEARRRTPQACEVRANSHLEEGVANVEEMAPPPEPIPERINGEA